MATKVKFPANIINPIGAFLQDRLKSLERQKKKIEKDDPFEDQSRVLDNASPDNEASEQFVHAKTSAIKEQLDKKIIQTRKALTMIRIGRYGICASCGKMIDTDRLMIYPEATLCVACERKREREKQE